MNNCSPWLLWNPNLSSHLTQLMPNKMSMSTLKKKSRSRLRFLKKENWVKSNSQISILLSVRVQHVYLSWISCLSILGIPPKNYWSFSNCNRFIVNSFFFMTKKNLFFNKTSPFKLKLLSKFSRFRSKRLLFLWNLLNFFTD